jgi:hypothetical protein
MLHPLMTLKADNFSLFRIVISEMLVNAELRDLYYAQILAPTLALGEEYLARHAAARGLSPTAARLTMRAISGMIMGLMLEHAMGDDTLAAHWEELPDVVVDLIVNGLKPSSQ